MMTKTTASAAGSWRELLGRDYGGATNRLWRAGDVHAINEFITMSLLPSAVADIGGERFTPATTVYLVSPVVAAMTVGHGSRLGSGRDGPIRVRQVQRRSCTIPTMQLPYRPGGPGVTAVRWPGLDMR